MKSKFLNTTVLAASVLAGSVGLATVIPAVTAGAETTTASADAAAPTGRSAHAHPLLRKARRHEVEVAARTIGVTGDELRADLKAGQSVADVATSKGVPVDTVVKAVVADLTPRIEKAVTNGRITRDRADKIEAKLPGVVTRLVNAHRAHPAK